MKNKSYQLELSLCLLIFQSACLYGSDVYAEKIHKEPETLNEDPEDYLEMMIDKEIYRCGSIGDWILETNIYGLDVVMIPKGQNQGYVGFRLESCLDPFGKPYLGFTQQLFEAQLKRLKVEDPKDERKLPVLDGSSTTVEFELLRIEEVHIWKCRYLLKLVGDQLWTFVCESSPQLYSEAIEKFGVLSGTLSHIPSNHKSETSFNP